MDWTKLKTLVYFEDGSLRDIYVRRMTVDNWQRWIEHTNSNCIVQFMLNAAYRGHEIDFTAVSKYWRQPGSEFPSANLTIGNLVLQVYFGDESELELDLSPKDVTTIDDHRTLMDYLISVSNLLQKNVELTMENPAAVNEVLLSIRFGEVRVMKSAIL